MPYIFHELINTKVETQIWHMIDHPLSSKVLSQKNIHSLCIFPIVVSSLISLYITIMETLSNEKGKFGMCGICPYRCVKQIKY